MILTSHWTSLLPRCAYHFSEFFDLDLDHTNYVTTSNICNFQSRLDFL